MGGRLQFWGVWTTVLGILPTRYSCSPTAHKMDTSTGGPSQQPGPTPAALVLARSGGMPRVGALRLAASSAPTRPVPQLAIAARQEEEQSRLAIGPGNRIRPVGVADSSNTRVDGGCCASWRSDAASHARCGGWSIGGSRNPGSSGCRSGGICGGVFADASAARSDTVGRRMAHNAAAAGGVVAVSALQRRCQPQLGHYLQQMWVERQGDDAICKSSRGCGPLNQRTAHRVWSETEECAGKRAACRSCCCADAGQRRLRQRCPCPDCELSAWVEAAGGDGGASCLPF